MAVWNPSRYKVPVCVMPKEKEKDESGGLAWWLSRRNVDFVGIRTMIDPAQDNTTQEYDLYSKRCTKSGLHEPAPPPPRAKKPSKPPKRCVVRYKWLVLTTTAAAAAATAAYEAALLRPKKENKDNEEEDDNHSTGSGVNLMIEDSMDLDNNDTTTVLCEQSTQTENKKYANEAETQTAMQCTPDIEVNHLKQVCEAATQVEGEEVNLDSHSVEIAAFCNKILQRDCELLALLHSPLPLYVQEQHSFCDLLARFEATRPIPLPPHQPQPTTTRSNIISEEAECRIYLSTLGEVLHGSAHNAILQPPPPLPPQRTTTTTRSNIISEEAECRTYLSTLGEVLHSGTHNAILQPPPPLPPQPTTQSKIISEEAECRTYLSTLGDVLSTQGMTLPSPEAHEETLQREREYLSMQHVVLRHELYDEERRELDVIVATMGLVSRYAMGAEVLLAECVSEMKVASALVANIAKERGNVQRGVGALSPSVGRIEVEADESGSDGLSRGSPGPRRISMEPHLNRNYRSQSTHSRSAPLPSLALLLQTYAESNSFYLHDDDGFDISPRGGSSKGVKLFTASSFISHTSLNHAGSMPIPLMIPSPNHANQHTQREMLLELEDPRATPSLGEESIKQLSNLQNEYRKEWKRIVISDPAGLGTSVSLNTPNVPVVVRVRTTANEIRDLEAKQWDFIMTQALFLRELALTTHETLYDITELSSRGNSKEDSEAASMSEANSFKLEKLAEPTSVVYSIDMTPSKPPLSTPLTLDTQRETQRSASSKTLKKRPSDRTLSPNSNTSFSSATKRHSRNKLILPSEPASPTIARAGSSLNSSPSGSLAHGSPMLELLGDDTMMQKVLEDMEAPQVPESPRGSFNRRRIGSTMKREASTKRLLDGSNSMCESVSSLSGSTVFGRHLSFTSVDIETERERKPYRSASKLSVMPVGQFHIFLSSSDTIQQDPQEHSFSCASSGSSWDDDLNASRRSEFSSLATPVVTMEAVVTKKPYGVHAKESELPAGVVVEVQLHKGMPAITSNDVVVSGQQIAVPGVFSTELPFRVATTPAFCMIESTTRTLIVDLTVIGVG